MLDSRPMQSFRKQGSSPFRRAFLVLCALFAIPCLLCAQAGGTGAISGTITDPTGALVVSAQVKITNVATGDSRTVQTNEHGLYVASLLPPGQYTIEATKQGFKTVSIPDVQVIVAEIKAFNVGLKTGTLAETVTVATSNVQLETESSNLGRVTDAEMIESLPLVTRNYTQIIALNPGVSQEVNNAGTIGRGEGGTSTNAGSGSIMSQGATSADNNFEMNGIPVNDMEGSGDYSSGVPIPNPDTIQEFRVQTAQYDATTGRDAGAAVDLITKGGTNEYHATLFEFFRNEDLNANDWFSKNAGQSRPVLRQNQYGFTAGGPLVKKKVEVFGSWQGTRQANALDPSCHHFDYLPPLTDDRSPAGIGAALAGDYGYLGPSYGTVNADGTMTYFGGAPYAYTLPIAPQAMALLQTKLPNGQYLVPTPQHINESEASNPATMEVAGTSFLSQPGTFNENQWMANGDYLRSDRNKISLRYFGATSLQVQTLSSSTLGFPLYVQQGYQVGSISDTFTLTPNMVNQFMFGVHRTTTHRSYNDAFTFSDLGMNVPAEMNSLPFIDIYYDGFATGTASVGQFLEEESNVADILSWTKGKHQLTFGGGFGYGRDNMPVFAYSGFLYPLTWADFLAGQSFATFGVPWSNIYESLDGLGNLTRDWRYKNGDAFVQDNFVMTRRLTFNLGLRYEHIGDLGAANGTGNLDLADINPNPPATGSYDGLLVSSNYKGTALPPGVIKGGNTFGFNGQGQNTWNPRLGFAWMLPGSERFLLRGGVGVYHTTVEGQMNLQLSAAEPFAMWSNLVGSANAAATDAQPFATPPNYPTFVPYSPTTNFTMDALDMGFRPPTTYHYSLGLQTQLPAGTVFDVGYVGARDMHAIMGLLINQANLASPSNPIRGQTTNTIANIPLRVPYEGFGPSNMEDLKTANTAWYNALEASLSQQWKHRLQYQASYTWARLLTYVPGFTLANNSVGASGDQHNLRTGYGPDPYIRPQRFVLSAVYNLPGPAGSHRLLANTFGGWSLSTATVAQSGHWLSMGYTNTNSVYGLPDDRASWAAGCTAKDLPTKGSVSHRVSTGAYINSSCLATPAVVGDDGSLGFGDTSNGVMRGPDQVNADISLAKAFNVNWPKEDASVQFRTDFFNAFNHPSFADPGLSYGTATFGTITSMSTNPRLIQFSLRLSF